MPHSRERLLAVELLAGKNQALLVDDAALLLLDLGLDVLDLVALLALDGDGLAGQRLDEELLAAARDPAKRGEADEGRAAAARPHRRRRLVLRRVSVA